MKKKTLDVEDFILIRFSLGEQIQKTKEAIIYYTNMIRLTSALEQDNHTVYTIEGFERQKSSNEKNLKDLEKLLALLEQGDNLTMTFKKP